MKQPNKAVIILIGIPILILLFFSSNIYGYFRFKSYCSSEGGLRVYEKLERNVGWLADDKYNATLVAQLKYVAFVRYKDKDGSTYDMRYIGGDVNTDVSYKIEQADLSKSLTYKWVSIYKYNEIVRRLNISGQEVFNIYNGRKIVTFYDASYVFFNREHMLLDMAHITYCSEEETNFPVEPNFWLKKFDNAFN